MRLLGVIAAVAVLGGLTVATVAAATDSGIGEAARSAAAVAAEAGSAAPARDARAAGGDDAAIPGPSDPVRVDPGDVPARLTIPAIGVDTPLVDLGIAGDGTMEVPTDYAMAGWLTTAPAPGERGPAIIAGHVDTHEGPAVFFRLRELTPGDTVTVTQEDGDVVTFTVRTSRTFAKDDFPTELVYGPAPGPVLRLITCSGSINPVTGHYTDNTVVFAS